ncbi:LLM class flavin-dependent oxidoreductase [Antarcticirhabdus aurantiaca]|uniref:LLM class flavin-dependent oxidoreductase n=1 Tax=Antarcticirhabdus aurantiaca TaxID=2606717 RepID=A0ACD4NMW9_9HYPH|nr:LLM class flavin-dependent oxidoreductase [Antarcticirhabdus aurantiaca]WAJ28209.1 LLM class flavin-dependent oxidoreductase [Jeongeuplla avenae]
MNGPSEFLWYIPNQSVAGHRGDTAAADHNSLDTLVAQAEAIERNGWTGALLGTGWGRPDTFTVAATLAARTTRFEPLVAIRPGYWQPALAASALATLDNLTGGRVRVNIVSGIDDPAAYGDGEFDKAKRYERTQEFMQILRRLWTQDGVSYDGRHFTLTGSTLAPKPVAREGRAHPTLYFGGASEAAERVAAAEADVQLVWGEPLADVAERIARLRALSDTVGRRHAPLEFGLRITTLVRETSGEAWRDAEAKVADMARTDGAGWHDHRGEVAVGQRRLLDLQARGDVLDTNLFTAPGRYGGGGAGTTWLVGSAEEVAASLNRYRALGVSHFILSDTPYLREIERQGRTLLPLLGARGTETGG